MVWSSCSPRDSQQSSPTQQFKSISTSALSFLYGSSLICIHEYWKIHSFTRRNLSSKVKSLLFNALSRMVIAFLPKSMLSGKLELIYRGSTTMRKITSQWNKEPRCGWSQLLTGEVSSSCTWREWTTFHVAHTHMSAPPPGEPIITDVISAFYGHTGTWIGAGRRGTAPLKLPQEPRITERHFVLPSD